MSANAKETKHMKTQVPDEEHRHPPRKFLLRVTGPGEPVTRFDPK